MLFDSHAHLNFSAFDNDRDQVLDNCRKEKIWMANVGTNFETSKTAVELAKKYPEGVYASIGLHPSHAYSSMSDPFESPNRLKPENFEEVDFKRILSEKVVAVGECGLDYFRLSSNDLSDVKKQKEEFEKQVDFAKKLNLPLIIHCRSGNSDAYLDLLDILKSEKFGKPSILHSFTDTLGTAKKFLDLGFYIALNAILIFDKSGNLKLVAKNLPSDRILIETDSPYLTPPPFRGKRNSPLNVRLVAEKIGLIRNESIEDVADKTFNNALSVFGIKKSKSTF